MVLIGFVLVPVLGSLLFNIESSKHKNDSEKYQEQMDSSENEAK